MSTNPVTKPLHYCRGGIEPLDFIQSNNIPFLDGNVIKYVFRHRDKGGLQDLLKARFYLDRIIDAYVLAHPSEAAEHPELHTEIIKADRAESRLQRVLTHERKRSNSAIPETE